MTIDADALRASWARVARRGDDVPSCFYAYLFLRNPALRNMFPIRMDHQRDRFVAALVQVVTGIDRLVELVPTLHQLGRDHRRFGVTAAHYPHAATALLETLAHYLGDDFTDDLREQWTAAISVVAGHMIDGANAVAADAPPWHDAKIVKHCRPAVDIATFTIALHPPLHYRAGQSIHVQHGDCPRVWRLYSPANPVRDDHTVDLHVRAQPGGQLSNHLVFRAQAGDALRVSGPAGAGLTLDLSQGRDLLLLAGGTGFAPLFALAQEATAEPGDRRVVLYHGVRTMAELYSRDYLPTGSRPVRGLTVVPAISDDPLHPASRSTVVDAALTGGGWEHCAIYVCGSSAMVSGTVAKLISSGVPPENIHAEQYGTEGGLT